MTAPKQKELISMEEARIMLLEQKNDDFHKTLYQIERRLDNIDQEIKTTKKELKSEMRSNFFWTLGLIFGIYATAFGVLLGAVGKAYHWF